MRSSLHYRRAPSVSSHESGVAYDLFILLGWLALFGVGLKLLVGWPAAPVLPDRMPSWSVIQVWIQSPGSSPAGLVSWAAAIAWVVWVWTLVSVLLRVMVDLAEGLTRGARWVGSARLVSDWLTIPLIRRAVDASLAGLLLARVVAQSGIAEASPLPQAPISAAYVQASGVAQPGVFSFAPSLGQEVFDEDADDATGDVTYTVKSGDTLSGIALAYYGDPEQAERIYQANLGREQSDGRQFNRHGLILPGWTLVIPGATQGIVEEHDGERWYVVKPGDTLRGIAALQLGDEERYREVFDLNAGTARVGENGPVLSRPELIWPGLQLRLPSEPPGDDAGPAAPEAPDNPVDSPPAQPDPAPPEASVSEAVTAQGDRPEVSVPTAVPTEATAHVEPTVTAPTSTAVAPAPTPVVTKADPPEAPAHPSPEQAAVAGAGAAAAVVAAAALVVRRRRPSPRPGDPETDVRVEGGFAEADPADGLARRLARTSDPPTAIASLLGQAYVAVFAEELSAEQRCDVDGVMLAATRHGRTSTTLVLAAPVPARPHLIRCMRTAAERAFGEHVDVDGLVSRDGDVLVRVTWDPRHPVSGRVLELVGPNAGASLWPTPCLVPLLLLYDRQEFEANWCALSNVLLAAPAGGNVDVPVSALVASLVSAWRPEDLGLVLLAQPHTLPEELRRFPHNVFDTVNSADPAAVLQALTAVRQELDRRMAADATDEPDLVVVVRELGDLDTTATGMLKTIAAAGPRHRVRVVVASERPVAEVLQDCPFLDELGTRLVLQTRDEEESVALLGIPAGEELGPGGHALLRLESRVPIQGWARTVPGDYLARLLNLMGTREPRAAAPVEDHSESSEDGESPEEEVSAEAEPAQAEVAAVAPPAPSEAAAAMLKPATPWQGSPMLQRLRAAPIRVRCLGARDVWYGDRQLFLADSELLLLLAAHPITGIQSEALADMLWQDDPITDPARALRKRRQRLRDEFRRLAPELTAEPLPWDMKHGQRIVSWNPDAIASDAQEFLELLNSARTLEPADAIQAYEAALALYGGDLLEAADMPSFRWMYDGAKIALTLRSDYQRRQRETRLLLADLLAAGDEAALARSAELYLSLCAETPEDERLWSALFRIHERAGSLLGLQGAERRLRAALAELAPGDVDVDTVQLPPKLDRLLQEIKLRIGGASPESIDPGNRDPSSERHG